MRPPQSVGGKSTETYSAYPLLCQVPRYGIGCAAGSLSSYEPAGYPDQPAFTFLPAAL